MSVNKRVLAHAALLGAASASAWLGSAGLARAADQPAAPTDNAGVPAPAETAAAEEGQLQEVVVTATHFATAANQTPLSLSAVTVDQLNQQGVNSFNNLVGMVPSVQISASAAPDVATIDIRGIIQSAGAATTGFYLDEAPLQAYANGATNAGSGNGTPLPPIFDLQRVEVLEGPQGTLFGASSEGGTIRYITPEPSLTTWQAYAKLDGGQTDHANGLNYMPGIAVGGPLIPGVLGFRASVAETNQAGWIQMEDPISQQIVGTGLNSSQTQEFHGALLWKPNDHFTAKASFFISKYTAPFFGNTYDYSEPYQIAEPELGFNNSTITPAKPSANPKPVCVGVAACTAYKGTISYIRPAVTTGPYALAPFTIMGEQAATDFPVSQSLAIPSVNLSYDFPSFTGQLFSSYVRALGRESNPNTLPMTAATYDATEGPYSIPVGMTFLPGLANLGYQLVQSRNARNLWSEDLRFTSDQGPTQMGRGRFSWTAGLYYADEWEDAKFESTFPAGGMEAISEYLYGLTPAQRYGIGPLPFSGGVGADNEALQTETETGLHEWFSNTDAAIYGEGNLNVTDHLQVTLGVRESRPGFSFLLWHYGPTSQGIAVPTFQNGGATEGASTENVFTPKGELTYRLSPNKLVYMLVDKGFRPGGANTPQSEQCAAGDATYGLTPSQIPLTYGPDSDWNEEIGTKLGFAGGRAQLNADVYRLLWSGVQASVTPVGCGQSFTSNAGDAISEGFELSGQALLFRGLLLNASFGYDHAFYSENAIAVHGAPGFPNFVVAIEGQNFNITPWTGDIGARLDLASTFGIGGSFHPYIRADWTVQGAHDQSEFGISGWDPFTNHIPSIPLLNLRAGFDKGPVDLNIYALNASNSMAGTYVGGPTGCATAACTSYTNNTPFLGVTPANPPRTIGLQLTYVR